jgi:2'-hydroxyisoflavone reductase
VTAATYGALKAASERAAGELFGPVTIVRPTYVIGAHDTTLRFPYWVQRLRRGGTVAVPGPPTTTLQCIDARDLGHFVIGLATQHLIGAYHVTGPFPAPTFVDVIDRVARRVAPSATALVEVDPAAVDRHSLGEKFPLWPGPTDSTLNDLDAASAIAAGLTLRTVDESIDDVLAWWGDREWPREWLDPHEEDRLLADGASGAGAETTPTPR